QQLPATHKWRWRRRRGSANTRPLYWRPVPVRIIDDVEEARRTILRRRQLADVQATPDMLAANERIWGAPLQPDEIVERILEDVRARRDEAVREVTARLGGPKLE